MRRCLIASLCLAGACESFNLPPAPIPVGEIESSSPIFREAGSLEILDQDKLCRQIQDLKLHAFTDFDGFRANRISTSSFRSSVHIEGATLCFLKNRDTALRKLTCQYTAVARGDVSEYSALRKDFLTLKDSLDQCKSRDIDYNWRVFETSDKDFWYTVTPYYDTGEKYIDSWGYANKSRKKSTVGLEINEPFQCNCRVIELSFW